MLFVDGGERPKPLEPTTGRIAMARGIVTHAGHHLDVFQANTDRVLWGVSPTTGRAGVTLVHVSPLSPENELALDIEVKHAIEDLHSALEYAAMEVYERLCCRRPEGDEHPVHTNIAFPIPDLNSTPTAYAEKINAIFPGLRERNEDVFGLILGFRQFACGNQVWLDTLHSAWSEVKHRRLGRDVKPMAILTSGQDPATAPSIRLYYFPGTTRSVYANLFTAMTEISKFLEQLEKSLA